MRLPAIRRWLVLALSLIVVASGVAARADEGGEGGEAKTYGEGTDGLKSLWTDVLAKAKAGDEASLKGMLEKMVMTEEDFGAVFPEEKAKDLSAKYAEKFVKLWPNEAKHLLAKVKEREADKEKKPYADVEVVEHVASKAGEGGDKTDKKILSLLKEGTKMYYVRLKPTGEKTGLRYDSFFYVNGAWKTGMKLSDLAFPKEKKKSDKTAKGGEKPPAPPPAPPPAEGEKKPDGEGEKKPDGEGEKKPEGEGGE